MPIYLFENTKTGEIREVILHSSEVKDGYKGKNGKETCWNRVYTAPAIMTDTANRVDPYKLEDFKRVTENKKGTLGDVMEFSKELSEKRAEKEGKDPVKQKMFDDYKAKRHGKEHPAERMEKLKEKGLDVNFKSKRKK